jgi:hypothetical protein
MVDVRAGPKIRLNANRYPGRAVGFGRWDRRLKNEKCYEQTRHLIENKRSTFANSSCY